MERIGPSFGRIGWRRPDAALRILCAAELRQRLRRGCRVDQKELGSDAGILPRREGAGLPVPSLACTRPPSGEPRVLAGRCDRGDGHAFGKGGVEMWRYIFVLELAGVPPLAIGAIPNDDPEASDRHAPMVTAAVDAAMKIHAARLLEADATPAHA